MISIVLLMRNEISYRMSDPQFTKIAAMLKFALEEALEARGQVSVYELPARRTIAPVDVQVLILAPAHAKWLTKLPHARNVLSNAIKLLQEEPDTNSFLIELNEVEMTLLMSAGTELKVDLHT
jgi:hypothetical protein